MVLRVKNHKTNNSCDIETGSSFYNKQKEYLKNSLHV